MIRIDLGIVYALGYSAGEESVRKKYIDLITGKNKGCK